jgi:hypothetical protein
MQLLKEQLAQVSAFFVETHGAAVLVTMSRDSWPSWGLVSGTANTIIGVR